MIKRDMPLKESCYIWTFRNTFSWIKFLLIVTKDNLHSEYIWGKDKFHLFEILNGGCFKNLISPRIFVLRIFRFYGV